MIALAVVHLLVYGVVARRAGPPLARGRLVLTTQGPARGYFVPHPPHFAFLGLPYARPPTRYDRFKAPKPPPRWSGVFEATHRIRCPQPDGSGDENCLVVNVFAPEDAVSSPVVVYFHDGSFQSGWGSHKALTRLLRQSFVYVTFNYRIGMFGFLCLGTADASGNAGLKDQVAALYWIQKNIKKFGGNPLDVTVYGTGSGAVSIELLMLSGLTEGLFQKVILEAGSALSPSSISYEPKLDAFIAAQHLGYEGDINSKSLQEFFYGLSKDELSNISRKILPCIEEEAFFSHSFLDRDPRDILQSGGYQHTPMIITYGDAEEISMITDNVDMFSVIPENFESLLPNNLRFDNQNTKAEVARIVKDFYFEEIELSENIVKSYKDYVNDVFMEYPVIKSVSYHSRWNTVFLMEFSDKKESIPAKFKNIIHYISETSHTDDEDELISERLISVLANFIKLSDPTPISTPLIPEIWQPVKVNEVMGAPVLRNIPYLKFISTMVSDQLSGHTFRFWDRIYDKFYVNLHTDVLEV